MTEEQRTRWLAQVADRRGDGQIYMLRETEYLALCAAITAEATARERERCARWRPIETAPRDGTLCMVWAAPYQDLNGFVTWCAYHEDGGWCIDELRKVTHWMPLPDGPSAAAHQAGEE